MAVLSQFRRNVTFLRQVWKNKRVVRDLLDSENYVFIRDFPPGHFYSPIPDLGEALSGVSDDRMSSDAIWSAIDLNHDRQQELMGIFARLYPEMPFPDKPITEARYYLDNSLFSYGDGIILYSFLRHFKPRRIIEIGSGFSSAAMLDVNDRFFKSELQFTFIEPFPDRLHALLAPGDERLYEILAHGVRQVDLGLFGFLGENDFLFIDSSHIGKTGSDVLHLLFCVLPMLKKGVIVHFHDILWPFEYPQVWLRGGRAWNEAYFLRAFLEYNSAFELLYFNSFMAARHREAIRDAMPAVLKTPSNRETMGNSSLWLRKLL